MDLQSCSEAPFSAVSMKDPFASAFSSAFKALFQAYAKTGKTHIKCPLCPVKISPSTHFTPEVLPQYFRDQSGARHREPGHGGLLLPPTVRVPRSYKHYFRYMYQLADPHFSASSFSSVSKPNFGPKYALFSAEFFRDLHEFHSSAPLQIQQVSKTSGQRSINFLKF